MSASKTQMREKVKAVVLPWGPPADPGASLLAQQVPAVSPLCPTNETQGCDELARLVGAEHGEAR